MSVVPLKQKFAATAFAAALAPGGTITLGSKHPDREGFHWQTFNAEDAQGIENWIAQENRDRNIYFYPNLPAHANKKAKKAGIKAVYCYWADLDCGDQVTLEAKQHMLKIADSFPVAPTAAIDSGNGVQLFWKLKTPHTDFAKAEEINKSIQQFFKSRNIKADAVWNIDRIMRLGGTINYPDAKKRKHGRTIVQGKILFLEGPRYDKSFDPCGDWWTRCDAGAKLQDAIVRDGPLSKLARGDVVPYMHDTSGSGFDHFFVGRLMELRFNGDEIQELFDAYPYGKTDAERRSRPDYLDNIIAKWSKKLKDSPTHAMEGFHFVRMAEVVPKPMDWLVEGYVPAGQIVELFGDSGTYKSTMAFDLAVCIAAGIPWHGHTVRQGAVLIIAGEGMQGIRNRCEAIVQNYDTSMEVLPLWLASDSAQLMHAEVADLVVSAIDAASVRPAFILLDTYSTNYGGEENSNSDINKFLINVKRIAKQYGTTVCSTHHSGHNEKFRSRGGSAKHAGLDAEYHFEKRGALCGRISCTKMRDAKAPGALDFRLEAVPLPFGEDSNDTALVPLEVSPAEMVREDSQPQRKRGKWERRVISYLVDQDLPLSVPVVLDKVSEMEPAPKGRDRRRDSAKRALLALVDAQELEVREGKVVDVLINI